MLSGAVPDVFGSTQLGQKYFFKIHLRMTRFLSTDRFIGNDSYAHMNLTLFAVMGFQHGFAGVAVISTQFTALYSLYTSKRVAKGRLSLAPSQLNLLFTVPLFPKLEIHLFKIILLFVCLTLEKRS